MVTSLAEFFSRNFLMTDKIVILCTCSTEIEAVKLARMLLDQRLAACVSIVPQVRSYYRWQGAIESSEEWMLVVKSARALFEPLSAALQKAHSYEIPEIIALPVVEGAPDYLNWLDTNLGTAREVAPE
jgi:periplasmic divalent cation tolerance protein